MSLKRFNGKFLLIYLQRAYLAATLGICVKDRVRRCLYLSAVVSLPLRREVGNFK